MRDCGILKFLHIRCLLPTWFPPVTFRQIRFILSSQQASSIIQCNELAVLGVRCFDVYRNAGCCWSHWISRPVVATVNIFPFFFSRCGPQSLSSVSFANEQVGPSCRVTCKNFADRVRRRTSHGWDENAPVSSARCWRTMTSPNKSRVLLSPR